MKTLIIGGTGTISTSITRFLLERGDKVTLYNRGKSPVYIPEKVKVVIGDRTNYQKFEAQMSDIEYQDCVIDMLVFKPEEMESAIRAFRGKVGQYIFCSTCDVYTKKAKNFPIREDAERKPLPSFLYGYGKATCENLLLSSHEKGGIHATIIRPNATYCDFKMPAVHSFRGGTYHLDRLLKNKPFITHGDGQSIWLECHSEDVGRAFANAAGNSKTFGKAYHVSGEERMTWDTVWKTVAEVIGAPEPRFIHIPTDLLMSVAPDLADWCYEHFQYNNFFDNAAAARDLGFKYTITWREGFKRYFKWLREHEEIENSENYPAYDRIVEAWQRLTTQMVTELKGKSR